MRKTWLPLCKHSATSVNRLDVVLQLGSIEVNDPELWYQTQAAMFF